MLTSLTHTTTSSKAPAIVRKWHLVDAKGMVLGKVATKVATLLQGKHKVSYVDHLDTGDSVVVINAGQVVVTGRTGMSGLEWLHLLKHHFPSSVWLNPEPQVRWPGSTIYVIGQVMAARPRRGCSTTADSGVMKTNGRWRA